MINQVGGSLIRVSRLHRTVAGQLLREVGLHPGQELLMMHLWEHGAQRQGELSKVLDVDASTLTRMVQRLEQTGFVRRLRCERDGRAWYVESTAAGRALRDRVVAAWEELEKIALDGLTQDQCAALAAALERMGSNLCGYARHEDTSATC
ncbi:MarR family winged helix-turn-helix transcriptional regulator [Allokutzneria oryzae]|uniref:MarR family winged helix-turn-helix transcriptional regulator n=1 Tax=Allokutzneria oryzae TaxID=1378989 RepID=A0ABV6A176_9PSEU